MSAPTSPVTPRRAALVFIFVTVLLDILAVGMIFPVLPQIVVGFVGGDTAKGAEVFGLFSTAWALMQFIFSPILGALSDQYGRRRVILLSNVCLGLDYILLAVAPNLGWLFIARVLSGITAASISTANAYIADVTPSDKRAAAFGMLGAAIGVGFVLGPALGGVLGGVNVRLPFWVAAVMSLGNALYGLFVLPESLPLERRRRFEWRRANPVAALLRLRGNAEVVGLATVHFLHNLAHTSLPSVFVLFAGYRFGWDARGVGLALGGSGLCTMIVQGGLVRRVVPRLGERRTLLMGLVFGMLGFTTYAFAPTPLVFCAVGMPLMALWGFFSPSSQGLMTRRVAPSEQGQFQGTLASLLGIAGMIGPGLFTQTFAAAIAPERGVHTPGLPFLLSAMLLSLGFVLALRATREPLETVPVTAR